MEALLRDLRYAARTLLNEPAVTLLATAALALGIGASTAIFTVVDSVLLRPLPYKDPERLVVTLHGPAASGPLSPADYLDYKNEARSFERLAAAQGWGFTLGEGERPERITALQVSADLFDLLGVPALEGRTFVEGEDRPGRDQLIVLSHGLWQRRFGADRSIVGKRIAVDGRPFEVVGVMPQTFRFAPFWISRAEAWVPLSLERRREDRGGRSLRVFGRLKDGVDLAEAQAEMTAIAARLERSHPETNTRLGVTVRPLLDKAVSGIRPTLLALMAMVTFVLLIACANVANTLLARASSRQREIAVRAAIGAGRGAIVRQLLTESVLLAVLGAAAGVVFAKWGVQWLLSALPAGSLPRQQEIGFDSRVLMAAALATLAAGIATGVAPVLQILKVGLITALQDGGKGVTEGAGRKRLRGVLVTAEVTLALLLLAGASLMGRTMMKLAAVDPGFQVDGVAVASVSLAGTAYTQPDAKLAMYRRIRERLSTTAGISAVSTINHLPLAGDLWTLGYTIEGRPTPPPGQRWSAVYRIVDPGYFAAVGLPLIRGRDFTDADSGSSTHVAIINKVMADRRWPGEDPIGRRIHLPGPGNVKAPITIVGVAASARQSDWTSALDDEVYVALAQRVSEFGTSSITFVMRTTLPADRVAASVPVEIARLDRTVPVSESTTLSAVVADELWRERLTAQLTGTFAIVALGLAAIGVYAVVSYSVARRAREFGVRAALGATRLAVVRLALTEAMRPVAAGTILGVLAALASSRFTQTLLFEVSAIDPLALAGAAAVLLAVAAIAAWIPARRASRLDPVSALRRQ
jgi:predicted permease